MVHIGNKIKQVHKESGLSVTAFAEKIATSRRNVYIIFGRSSVDTALLERISKVLGHDFFRYYSTTLPEEGDRLRHLEKEIAGLKQAIGRLSEKAGK